MKIAVLLKVVPDTYAVPKIEDNEITWGASVEWVRDRYSEFAVEEAVKTKEALGGELISYTITPVNEQKPIRKALAVGVDKAVVIENQDLFESDAFSIARALAEEIKEQDPDLIFAGKFSSDSNNRIIGPAVAAFLNIPAITEVSELEVKEDGIIAKRKVGTRKEVFEAKFPVLITTEKGLNEPRYPKLPNIMKAKRKPTDWKNDAKSEMRNNALVTMIEEPKDEKGEVVMLSEGEISDRVAELIRYLKEEENVL